MNNVRLIETNKFDFEFLSRLAEKESWRKEIHRPIYHLHKWWAKRLGSVFRGILLGSLLPETENLHEKFYSVHNFSGINVFDPFMGSGTTIGEAHKLGLTTLGRDINPISVESVRVSLGPIDQVKINAEFGRLEEKVGRKILNLYRSKDSENKLCDILYYFWVMQVECPECTAKVDLFPSRIIARNAYPKLKPEVQLSCPRCGEIFRANNGNAEATCISCQSKFDPTSGNAKGAKATCEGCKHTFSIIHACKNKKPFFRLYGKLILKENGEKEYLKSDERDLADFDECSQQLVKEINKGAIVLPNSFLKDGYNTKQAINYGFTSWRDFFNDRQLLALGWLNTAIAEIKDKEVRDLFLLLFSGVLEFNNMFASYKGEGTGAVRHMFSHHILKPERVPIEANVWGTYKSSGSFSSLFQKKVKRATMYRKEPTEVSLNGVSLVSSNSFSGKIESGWPTKEISFDRKIYLSCGDSAKCELPTKGVDLVITDPPFFDNVHYSELADFFHSWQKLIPRGFVSEHSTTRSTDEVQDSDFRYFAEKLGGVFKECSRILKDNGLLVFTYHHSRDEGWQAIAEAIKYASFEVVNVHPVKSELSVATPKSQTQEPIQIDMIIVCRKMQMLRMREKSPEVALLEAEEKIRRLEVNFSLSKNDKKVIRYGQLLTAIRVPQDISPLSISLVTESSHVPVLKVPRL
ncbi:MAG: adenine-specific DNA methylase [bacterium]|nr:adenine-specific DNA methylase [bacterium]